MKVCVNLLIFTFVVFDSSFSEGTESENKAKNLDPRYLVPFHHLFTTPGSSERIALRFINDIMQSENPKLCDVIAYINHTLLNSTTKFDIVCAKLNSNRPVALIGIQPIRFESTSREISQYEVAEHYYGQLEGLDWKERVHQYKNLIPVLSILVSHFEAGRIDRILKHSKMLDTWSYENLYEDFAITTLYLDKCRERVQRDSIVMKTDLDKWCYFFTYAGSYSVGEFPEWTKDDDVMKLAFATLDPRKYNEAELKVHNETVKATETSYAAFKKAVEDGRWKVGKLK